MKVLNHFCEVYATADLTNRSQTSKGFSVVYTVTVEQTVFLGQCGRQDNVCVGVGVSVCVCLYLYFILMFSSYIYLKRKI